MKSKFTNKELFDWMISQSSALFFQTYKLAYDTARRAERDYEITRHVSLMLNDPMALISLKETGRCTIDLPEALFDADYPGHYMRRIKSVSLTIPCVLGPYTGINCTLTLLTNKTRISNIAGDQYAEKD